MPTITDLTNTAWYFNSILSTTPGTISEWNLQFTSNDTDTSFTYFNIENGPAEKSPYISYSPNRLIGTTVYSIKTNTWTNDAYRTIYITGGSDATTSGVITWIQNNATYLGPVYTECTINYKTHYPIGSIVITSTNSSPASKYGGTWQLIDKEFKHQSLTSGFFAPDSNVSSVDYALAVLTGHKIYLRLRLTAGVDLTDSVTSPNTNTLGTINANSIGLVTGPNSYNYFITPSCNNSDAAKWGYCMVPCIATNTQENFTLSFLDSLTRTTSGILPSGSRIWICGPLQIEPDKMLDSFCDKFYWERTA